MKYFTLALILLLIILNAKAEQVWDTPEECHINTDVVVSNEVVYVNCNGPVINESGSLTLNNVKFYVNSNQAVYHMSIDDGSALYISNSEIIVLSDWQYQILNKGDFISYNSKTNPRVKLIFYRGGISLTDSNLSLIEFSPFLNSTTRNFHQNKTLTEDGIVTMGGKKALNLTNSRIERFKIIAEISENVTVLNSDFDELRSMSAIAGFFNPIIINDSAIRTVKTYGNARTIIENLTTNYIQLKENSNTTIINSTISELVLELNNMSLQDIEPGKHVSFTVGSLDPGVGADLQNTDVNFIDVYATHPHSVNTIRGGKFHDVSVGWDSVLNVTDAYMDRVGVPDFGTIYMNNSHADRFTVSRDSTAIVENSNITLAEWYTFADSTSFKDTNISVLHVYAYNDLLVEDVVREPSATIEITSPVMYSNLSLENVNVNAFFFDLHSKSTIRNFGGKEVDEIKTYGNSEVNLDNVNASLIISPDASGNTTLRNLNPNKNLNGVLAKSENMYLNITNSKFYDITFSPRDSINYVYDSNMSSATTRDAEDYFFNTSLGFLSVTDSRNTFTRCNLTGNINYYGTEYVKFNNVIAVTGGVVNDYAIIDGTVTFLNQKISIYSHINPNPRATRNFPIRVLMDDGTPAEGVDVILCYNRSDGFYGLGSESLKGSGDLSAQGIDPTAWCNQRGYEIGHIIGTTSSQGYVEANLTFNASNYENEYLLAADIGSEILNETLVLGSSTPITLTQPDRIPPYIKSEIDNYVVSSSLDVSYHVEDNVARVLYCEFRLGDQKLNQSVLNNSWSVFSVPMEGFPSGQHTANLSCEDESSNLNYTGLSVVVDTTSPKIEWWEPSQDTYHTTNINFTFSVTDDHAVQSYCRVYANSSIIYESMIANNSPVSFSHTLEEGENQNLSIICEDGVNNSRMEYRSVTVSLIVDETPPEINWTNPPLSKYNSTQIDFSFKVTDDYSSECLCAVYINSSQIWSGNVTNASVIDVTDVTDISNLINEGLEQNLSIICKDNLSNARMLRESVSVDFPPQVTLHYPLNIIVNNATVVFNFTAQDNLSSHVNCSLFVDGTFRTSKYCTGLCSVNISLEDEKGYNWYISASDGFSIVNSSQGHFVLDSSTPVITGYKVEPRIVMVGENITLMVNSTSSLNEWAEIITPKGEEEYVELTNEFETNYTAEEEGTYSVTLYAADSVGNSSVTKNVFAFEPVNFSLMVKDLEGNALPSYMKLYVLNYEYIDEYSPNGSFMERLPSGIFHLELSSLNENIAIHINEFDTSTFHNEIIKLGKFKDEEWLTYVIESDISAASKVCFRYSYDDMDMENPEFYMCSDWNGSGCAQWNLTDAERNEVEKLLCKNIGILEGVFGIKEASEVPEEILEEVESPPSGLPKTPENPSYNKTVSEKSEECIRRLIIGEIAPPSTVTVGDSSKLAVNVVNYGNCREENLSIVVSENNTKRGESAPITLDAGESANKSVNFFFPEDYNKGKAELKASIFVKKEEVDYVKFNVSLLTKNVKRNLPYVDFNIDLGVMALVLIIILILIFLIVTFLTDWRPKAVENLISIIYGKYPERMRIKRIDKKYEKLKEKWEKEEEI